MKANVLVLKKNVDIVINISANITSNLIILEILGVMCVDHIMLE